MEDTREKLVKIGAFSGMVADADPRDIERAVLAILQNALVEVPGKVISRRGLVPSIRNGDSTFSHWSPNKPSHLVVRNVLDEPMFVTWQSQTSGATIFVGRAEANPTVGSTQNQWKALHNSSRGYMSNSYPKPTMTRTSAGEVFLANGFNPMMKWGGRIGSDPSQHVVTKIGNQVLPAGIDAPTAAPTVSVSYSGGNSEIGDYLVAFRYVDHEGNPSNLSPTATVSPTATGATISWSSVPSPATSFPSYDRITKKQIFRSTVGEADRFYLVAEFAVGTTSYSDTLSDDSLLDQSELPLLNNDGSPNANRFGVPPLKPIVVWHQDRLYAAGSLTLSAGTVSISSGATTGNGTSTTFQASMAGWEMTLNPAGADETYIIDSFSSTSAFTLSRASETTFTGASYVLRPSLSERNRIYYSEAEEPEAWPVEQNYVELQDDAGGYYDEPISALMPMGPTLYVLKPTRTWRLDSIRQPSLDAALSPVATRGCFNHWCWGQVDGMAYLMDRLGCWSLGAGGAQPIGDPIANYFREGLIDFSLAANFFVSTNRRTKTVRFHVALANQNQASSYPMWAFCWCYRTQSWSLERYAWGLTGAGTFRKSDGSDQYYVLTDSYGVYYETTGGSDHVTSPVRSSISGVTNGATASTYDYTCRATISGLASSYVGSPLWVDSGTGKGAYGLITSVITTDVYNLRLLYLQSPLAAPVAGDTVVVGGVPYNFLTKQFSLLESGGNARREASLWFKPLNSTAAAFDIRHYLDHATTPDNAVATQPADGDLVAMTEGSPDGTALMYYLRNSVRISGVARKRIGYGTNLHDVPTDRTVQIEVRGVAADERHEFRGMDLEGVA